MEWVIKEEDFNVPIKSWCAEVEEGAMLQAKNLARHPLIFHHVALMPDCHQGYGMPIGGVIATRGGIIVNAVGVDIGCGMIASKTNFSAKDLDKSTLDDILTHIKEEIPVGFKHHATNQDWVGFNVAPDIEIVQQELESAKKQLGTLGGGNHFIEIQKSSTSEELWVMIHSGSRNFGYKIAEEYNKKSIALCAKWHSQIPDKYLAFLPIDTIEAQEYLVCMGYALKFAEANRDNMLSVVTEILKNVLNCEVQSYANIHHNFVALENHFGSNVYVHRKGATLARKEQLGIIPGSMGTPSYIVEGLGNPESFCSCSHGAGRKMGRKEASRTLSKEECDNAMKDISFVGWGKDRKGQIDLGEAPQAYKDIDTVITAELDLIKPIVKLQPLGVVKG